MLIKLYVKNYVLIDELNISFGHGLNIITGETGAGKSILVGALGTLLGERFGKEMIRAGADRAIVEGEFDLKNVPDVIDYLKQNDLDDGSDQLIIRREVGEGRKSRCFVNDTPVPVSALVVLGDLLVDLHGQHQHQLLLKVAQHGKYLDRFAGLGEELNRVNLIYDQLLTNNKELYTLQQRAQDLKKTRDLTLFQLNEIKAVDPQPDEDEVLQREEQILRHAELLYESTNKLSQELYESDGSASEVLSRSEHTLYELVQIDQKFESLAKECQNARIIVDELGSSVQRYNQGITFDPDRLENVRQRMNTLAGLKKKYGGTIHAVIELKEKLEKDLTVIENLDEHLKNLQAKVEESRKYLSQITFELSRKRRDAAEDFSHKVVAILSNLGMSKVKFNVAQKYDFVSQEPYVVINGENVCVGPRGADHIEFLLSANPGEDFKPLAEVASGGEISRIMLALKSLLIEVDEVPVLIFDEIDLGISGRIAQAVGRTLRELGHSHQILCITHLPQIASMAHYHFLVEKVGDDSSTRTIVQRLENEERTEHIARLFGGEIVSEAHLQSAHELIEEAERTEKE